jgi:Family of unknown function (DUF6062)
MHKDSETLLHSRDAEELREACGREGCPVCTVVRNEMERAMDTWQYEGFTDGEQREEVVRAHGFCSLHTWQLAQYNTQFQFAVVYKDILSDLLETIGDEDGGVVGPAQTWMQAVKRWFQPRSDRHEMAYQGYKRCPLCRTRTHLEQRIVECLVEIIQSEAWQILLRHSTGLCRHHFQQASHYAHGHFPEQYLILVICQRECLQRTLNDVNELIRKHDYRFREEPWGDEMTAWRRAAELCAGNVGVY